MFLAISRAIAYAALATCTVVGTGPSSPGVSAIAPSSLDGATQRIDLAEYLAKGKLLKVDREITKLQGTR